jgi:hypothetical protein
LSCQSHLRVNLMSYYPLEEGLTIAGAGDCHDSVARESAGPDDRRVPDASLRRSDDPTG